MAGRHEVSGTGIVREFKNTNGVGLMRQIDRQGDRKTGRQEDIETERHVLGKTGRLESRCMDRETGILTHAMQRCGLVFCFVL